MPWQKKIKDKESMLENICKEGLNLLETQMVLKEERIDIVNTAVVIKKMINLAKYFGYNTEKYKKKYIKIQKKYGFPLSINGKVDQAGFD